MASREPSVVCELREKLAYSGEELTLTEPEKSCEEDRSERECVGVCVWEGGGEKGHLGRCLVILVNHLGVCGELTSIDHKPSWHLLHSHPPALETER